jgi:hypothetical protein
VIHLRRSTKPKPIVTEVVDAMHVRAPSRIAVRREARRLLVLSALLTSALLLWGAAPALAAVTHPLLSSFDGTGSTPGAFSGVDRLALSQTSGSVYVLDRGNGTLDKFDSSGTAQAFTDPGLSGATDLAIGGLGGDPDVAVDNSGTASDGNIYVSSEGQGTVYGFAPSGAALPGFPLTPSGDICGVGVDPSGSVWVDAFGPLTAYDSAGNPTGSSFDPGFGSCHFAFDPTGNLYLAHWNGEVDKFNPSGGSFVADPSAPILDSGVARSVATDPASGHVFVAHDTAISEYDAFGASAGSFGSGTLSSALGVAAKGTSGEIYVSDNTGSGLVDVFGPAVTVPDVTTGAASNITQTSASLSGTVNPDGIQVSDCHFEYGTDTNYGQTAPCVETVGAGTAPVAVSAGIGGLQPSTVYHFRLVAGNANGSNPGNDQTFVSAGLGFGIAGFDGSVSDQGGNPFTQAGGHPYQASTTIDFNQTLNNDGEPIPDESVKDIHVELPAGFVGDPTAAAQCTPQQLSAGANSVTECPPSAQVGTTAVTLPAFGVQPAAVYNMVPPLGVPAQFAFKVLSTKVHLNASVRTGSDYGLTIDVRNVAQALALFSSTLTFWGVPADPSHDPQRSCPGGEPPSQGGPTCASGAPVKPFLTNPTSCTGPLTTTLRVDSWQHPGDWKTASFVSHDNSGNPIGVTGCDQLDFSPTISVQPDTTAADSPSGLHVDLHVPQNDDPDGLAEANLKQAVVTLPPGTSVNPAAADGLGACSPAQIALSSPDPATCPDSAKVGSVEIDTPLLDHPLEGGVFVAKQNDNPFGSLLAIYIAVSDPQTGVVVKLAGHVVPDPATGQLETTFDDNPQLPFSEFKLDFFGGPRAALATPQTCATYQSTSQLTPWSAPDSGPPATPSDSFMIDSGPGGGPCPDLTDPNRFTPGFQAGTLSPLAGSYSPFVLKVTRPDGQQYLKKIAVTLPLGLTAKLAGIPKCPQSAIVPGVGGSTNCPAASEVGTVNVGAGAGSSPFFLKQQPVYLTEGYGGAPFGLAIDTHALAGPFDLGHVVIRSKLNVDPQTAQVSADAEELPDIIQGIPLRIRSVTLTMDHPAFTLNPTNCNPQTIAGEITGGGADFQNPADDTVKPVSDHFQVAGCGALGFSPKLSGQILNGAQGIHRSDHPNLSFNLHATPGDANLASVAVTLPHAFQIDQANLGNICSETQLATNECAGRNSVGTASATTPLLDSTLSGPVYAVSGSGGLPKLAVILHGPAADPLHLLVRGITDTVGAQIRNTFPLVPDAPITDFNLTLNGGPAGYLVNNTDVCAGAKGRSKKARKKASRLRRTNLTAAALFTAQDGDTLSQKVPIAAQCPKAKKKSRRVGHRK